MQSRLDHISGPKGIVELSKSFITIMKTGNVNGVLKQLTNNMSSGVLSSDDITAFL